MPSEHMPCRRRYTRSRITEAILWKTRRHRQLIPLPRRGNTGNDGSARFPHHKRNGWSCTVPEETGKHRSLESGKDRLLPDITRCTQCSIGEFIQHPRAGSRYEYDFRLGIVESSEIGYRYKNTGLWHIQSEKYRPYHWYTFIK